MGSVARPALTAERSTHERSSFECVCSRPHSLNSTTTSRSTPGEGPGLGSRVRVEIRDQG